MNNNTYLRLNMAFIIVLTAISCNSPAGTTNTAGLQGTQIEQRLHERQGYPGRWSIKLSHAQEWQNSQEGFGGMGEFSDKTLGLMVPIGSRHNLSHRPLYFARSKDPLGWEWNDKVLVDDMADVDIRNGSVGIMSNDDIVGLFANREVSGSYLDPAVYYSRDDGETWSKLILTGMAPTAGNGHGNIIEVDNLYLGTAYRAGTVTIIGIEKDFSDWEVLKEYSLSDLASGLNPDDFSLSETCVVKVGDNIIYGMVRNQDEYGNTLEFYSDDGGESWSSLYDSGIKAGATPNTLYANDDRVYMVFPGRVHYGTDPNFGNNFILTYKPVSLILDFETNWAHPIPLFPIPVHGSSSNGDVERGHLFERGGSLFLLWKQGTYMDNSDGESIHWIKKIGRF